MSKKFIRTTENFTCENCKKKVKGDGYTNHCPNCLYSKHVDINPGDRAELCGGLMEPIFLELEKSEYKITHKCLKCGFQRRCKATKDDNTEALAKISESLAKKAFF